MGSMGRICAQSLLKVVNSMIGMLGIAMILYALWMFWVWTKHMSPPSPPPFFPPDTPPPWFIYTFLGLGVILCVIMCSGHIAAETANGCCLYFYIVFIVLLVMLEGAVTVDVFLNHNWEEDFPKDPTGNFDQFKDFIRENFDVCKWVALSVVTVQGLCVLLAMILTALGPHCETYYDSDDDYTRYRVPLLKNYVPPPSYVVADPLYGSKSDSWNIRINSKANR